MIINKFKYKIGEAMIYMNYYKIYDLIIYKSIQDNEDAAFVNASKCT